MTDSSEWSDRAPEEGRRQPLARGTQSSHDHGDLPTPRDVADALWLWGHIERGRDASHGDANPRDLGAGTTTPPLQLGSDPLPTEHTIGEGSRGYEDREVGDLNKTSAELYFPETVQHNFESTKETTSGRTDFTRLPSAGPGLRPDIPLISSILPDGLQGFHRALRPLLQTEASHQTVLDEETTADQLAHDVLGMLVHRPAGERRWEIVLVADESTSMGLWLDTVPGLVRTLERQNVFRDVHVRFLNTDTAGYSGLYIRGSRSSPLRHAPAELLEPTMRRIVWVLSDALGEAWRSGAMAQLLWTWARRLPVAVLNPLSHHVWHRTWLRHHRLRLAPSATSGTAVRWEFRDAWSAMAGSLELDDIDQVVPVPVLEPDARWIAPWARLVSGRASSWTDLPAVLAGPSAFAPPQDGGDPWEAPEPFPRARVRRFRALASPESFALATHLAAAPLTRAVIRRIMEMVPDAGPAHLSELFLGGLVRPVGAHEDAAALGTPEQAVLDFVPGVREELLAFGRRSDTKRVLLTVSDLLGPRVPAVRGMAQILENPDTAPIPPITEDTRPFLEIEAISLSALSGPYLARSRRLRALLDSANS